MKPNTFKQFIVIILFLQTNLVSNRANIGTACLNHVTSYLTEQCMFLLIHLYIMVSKVEDFQSPDPITYTYHFSLHNSRIRGLAWQTILFRHYQIVKDPITIVEFFISTKSKFLYYFVAPVFVSLWLLVVMLKLDVELIHRWYVTQMYTMIYLYQNLDLRYEDNKVLNIGCLA